MIEGLLVELLAGASLPTWRFVAARFVNLAQVDSKLSVRRGCPLGVAEDGADPAS